MPLRPTLAALSLSTGLAWCAAATPARAQEQERYELSYAAPTSCPSQSDFERAIAKRLPEWTRAEDAEDAPRRIRITITARGSDYVGELAHDASETPRRLDGSSCVSLVDALALVTALTLDPSATFDDPPAADGPPVAPPGLPSAPQILPESAPPDSSVSAPSRMRLGTGLSALFGPAPRALLGPQVHGEWWDGDGTLSLRLEAAHGESGNVAVGTAQAHFALTRVGLAGCYGANATWPRWQACVVTSLGLLRAEGQPSPQLERTKDSSRGWMASGVRAEVGVPLFGPLELSVEGGLQVPWVRHRYILENPQENVHETAPLAGHAGLLLSVWLN